MHFNFKHMLDKHVPVHKVDYRILADTHFITLNQLIKITQNQTISY
jgi:hypothetical protein